MEMEDHLNNQYNIDLRHFVTAGRPTTVFHPPPPPPPSLSLDHLFSRNHHHYDMTMLRPPGGSRLHEFHSDSTCNPHPPLQSLHLSPTANSGGTPIAADCSTPSFLCPLDADAGSFGGGDGGTGRWPRQETLTLLEIRSRLDPKFKEANQKGPLWDELSRIMSEEYGYQRSGKKCREKFENLYKYYKKTKEGKAGRQDGKHYRFFRQLEALYGGETSNPESQFGGTSGVRFLTGINTTDSNIRGAHDNSHSILSLSNSSGFDTCSSEDNSSEKRRKKRRSWKAKIKEFIDSQMRKLIEKQEAWLEKLTKTLEQNEHKRLVREEIWKNEEAARVEKEHKFWDKEKEWIEARDAALMDTLRKLISRDQCSPGHQIGRIRAQSPENNRNESFTTSNKKRKENSNSNCYYQPNYQETANTSTNQENAAANENCFPFLMSEENLWENYGMRLSKGN